MGPAWLPGCSRANYESISYPQFHRVSLSHSLFGCMDGFINSAGANYFVIKAPFQPREQESGSPVSRARQELPKKIDTEMVMVARGQRESDMPGRRG